MIYLVVPHNHLEKEMATDVMLKKIGDFPTDGPKVPPQLQVIVEALAKYEHGVERSKLAKEIEADLKTRQPPERVIQFYQKRLESEGVVEVTKIGGKPEKTEDDGTVKAAKPKKSKGKQEPVEDSVAA
jgi:hypothetical protein